MYAHFRRYNMKNYFSADFHLGHANVVKYDKRPFRDVTEMDRVILENCEELFEKGDNFYFLGDFCLGKVWQAEVYMRRLCDTGVNLFFIKGNHDKREMINLYNKYGNYLGEQKKIKVNNQEIVLNHYRMEVWEKSHHGVWHLHGHSHHSLPIRSNARCLDVGINGKGYNYSPVEFEYVSKVMELKTWEPIDHHGKKNEYV